MNYKIVTVIPAGRKQYLEILIRYLLANRSLINEHHFWVNTKNKVDINWMQNIARKYGNFFRLIYAQGMSKQRYSIYRFFPFCTNKDTIYIRLDDDICWIAPDALGELIRFRIENKDPFLVYPNIINNAVCTHLHQRFGAVPAKVGNCSYNAFCGVGWASGEVAAAVHKAFFNSLVSGTGINRFKFNEWRLSHYERVSVNCISWFGKDFAKFRGIVGPDEEKWLSMDKPARLRRPNVICGRALISHFAFYTQRPYLELQTRLLNRYLKLAESLTGIRL